MFRLSLFLTAVASATLSGPEEHDFAKFQDFMKTHKKVYSTVEEFRLRFDNFRQMLKLADARNIQNARNGGSGDAHGITQFSDLTHEEFKEIYLMKQGSYTTRLHARKNLQLDLTSADVDWREKGVVSPVKDQGQCGSCWAFSAIEAVESFGEISFGYGLTPLSAQQACSCAYQRDGCTGGNPQWAYTAAIERLGGIESNEDYPYTASCAVCNTTESNPKYLTTENYKNADYGTLQAVLDTEGPPSVAVAADSWNTYTGGVLADCPGSINHAVQAVGYNASATTPYWIVRNSWGTVWGNKGYIYLLMTGNTCHIQEDVNYPITGNP